MSLFFRERRLFDVNYIYTKAFIWYPSGGALVTKIEFYKSNCSVKSFAPITVIEILSFAFKLLKITTPRCLS